MTAAIIAPRLATNFGLEVTCGESHLLPEPVTAETLSRREFLYMSSR